MGLDDDAAADLIATGLQAAEFGDPDPYNPYYAPPEERVDDDSLDPNSVANPDGEDLDWIDPDEGEVVDILALEGWV